MGTHPRSNRGASLATVLMIAALGLIAAFSLAAVSFHHLNFGNALHNRQIARNLADSAVARTMERIATDQNFGKARTETVTVDEPDYPPGAQGAVTFDPARGRELNLGLSTNNVANGASVEGSNRRVVPDDTFQLFARGRCGGAEYSVETLVHLPPFPIALFSSGPVTSTGGLLVSAVASPQDFQGDIDQVAPTRRLPAHVASNNDGAEAVHLGRGADIRGNVQAVGKVRIDAGVTVSGEIDEGMRPVVIPDFRILDHFQQLDTMATVPLGSALSGVVTLEYANRTIGDLSVQGDIVLNGGVLYVPGNLEVSGRVEGVGAIFVRGKTHIARGASLTSDNQVALVCLGDIDLQGEDRGTSFFNGLVYSEGDIHASNLTVVGTVISNGIGDKGHLNLDNVTVIATPPYTRLTVGLPHHTNVDDDEGYFQAQPRTNPTTHEVRYTVSAVGMENGVTPVTNVFTAIDQTEDQAFQFILDKDKSFVISGRGADRFIASHEEAQKVVRIYLQSLVGTVADPPFAVFNLDFNRLLKRVDRMRILMWNRLD